MCGRIVHVRRKPYDVAHLAPRYLPKHPGQLGFAAARRPRRIVGDGLDANVVRHHQADRHVRLHDLPGRGAAVERLYQPLACFSPRMCPGLVGSELFASRYVRMSSTKTSTRLP
jgi:hypothetical protein